MVKPGRYAGMALEGDLASIAVVRAEERAFAVESRAAIPLPADGPTTAAAAAAERRPAAGAPLTIGLPGSQVLLRAAHFPTRDPVELSSMARLFAESIAPLPLDQMCLGIEEIATTDTGAHVWIALVRRSIVDELGDAFRRHGAPPERVDANLLGWWELRRETPEIAAGRQVIARQSGGSVEALAVDHGRPFAAAVLRAETPEMLGESLAKWLADLEWEHGPVLMDAVELSVRASSDDPWTETKIGAAIRSATGIAAVNVRKMADGETAEGLARRAARSAPAPLNLAPDEWRIEREQTARRRAVRRLALAIAALWAAGLAIFYVGLRWQRAQTTEAEKKAAALKGPADAVLELRSRLRSLEAYTARSHTALESLREISERLPVGVELTSFAYRKGATVSLRGLADRPEAIYDFLQALEQSPYFAKIESGQVQSRLVGGARRSEFSVTAHLPAREGGAP